MKKNIPFILFFTLISSIIFGQTDVIQNGNADPAVGQVPSSPQTIIVDTVAPVKKLPFETFSYDSLFSKQITPPDAGPENNLHLQKREIVLPLLLLLMLGYVTWLRYIFSKELSENITVILNSNLGQQIYRDREFSANIFKLLTFINFTFIGGVFIYLLSLYYGIAMPFNNKVFDIGICIGIIIVLYALKGIVYNIIGAGFKVSNALSFFRFNSLVIYHLLGILMLPLVIITAFSDAPVSNWALFATLALIGVAMMVRLVKGFSVIRLLGKFHIVYFLLYICALEIAPLLIAVKLFGKWGQ
ncbi:MAG: DUF4271 domain-containing protein [Chitinophagales bacterium]